MSDRKEDVKRIVLEIIELIDDKLFGDVMDLPCVDELEAQIVDCVVDYTWDRATATKAFNNTDADLFPWSA